MLEVLEEEELEALRHRQSDFDKLRNAELAEVQRLESEAKRKDDEKVRKLRGERREGALGVVYVGYGGAGCGVRLSIEALMDV